MPQQRLDFTPTSRRFTPARSNSDLALSNSPLHDSDEGDTSKCPSPLSRLLSSSSAPRPKPRTSWFSSHMPDEDRETRYYNQRTGKEEWRCRHCSKAYSCSGGTAAPAKHLTDPPPESHGLSRGAPRTSRVVNIRGILEQARLTAEENPRKRRRLNDQAGDPIVPDQLEALYVRFISACSLPFRLVECPEFRALLLYLNDDVDTWLPNTHETVKKWIIRQFDAEKARVKQRIRAAKSRIHISCDLWTSPNCLAILGIVSHYVTEDGQLEHYTLVLKDIDSEHSEHDGSHLAAAVGFCLKAWLLTMDNAANNDTMMASLSLDLLRRFDVHCDPKVRRLRCQGHIINLVAKAFLFVNDKETLERGYSGNGASLKDMRAWRERGSRLEPTTLDSHVDHP